MSKAYRMRWVKESDENFVSISDLLLWMYSQRDRSDLASGHKAAIDAMIDELRKTKDRIEGREQ